MDPNKETKIYDTAREAWFWFQDLSEGESEGGEITIDE